MKLKTLSLTVVVLAALSLAAWFLTRPPKVAGTDPRVGQPLVSNDLVQSAAQLKLTDHGKTVLLKKQPDHSWQVATYYDFPADFSKLAEFVRNLTAARIQRFVTANPERLKRLDFKDTAIRLLDASGKELWSLTLGKTADSGGRFVHFGAEKRAYLTKLNAWIDPDSHNWADSTLLRFKPADIARVSIDFPGATTIVAHRSKAGDSFVSEAAPKGDQVKAATYTNLLRSLSELHFTDTTAPDDPAAKAAASHDRTVQLTTFSGVTYTVKLGRTPESKKLKPAGEAAPPQTNGTPPAEQTASAEGTTTPGKAPAPPAKPEYETIPPGPVFVTINCSEASAPINALMAKRAFKVADYSFTSLPQSSAELFEPIPPPPPPKKSDKAPAPAPQK